MTPDQLLQRLADDPSRTGLLFDFDGTLAPIVEDPSTSALPAGLDGVLADLAARFGLMAIISGRPASFLGERAAVPGATLLGLYGLERLRGGQVEPLPDAVAWQAAAREAGRRLADGLAGDEGVHLEDKGLSVAVHWRRAPDRDAAARRVVRLVERVAASTGLARAPGKFVEELRPPVDCDKGTAVRAAVGDADLALLAYFGDDRGDLPAFAAVRDLGGLGVAVGHGTETAEEVRASADVVLDGTEALGDLLRRLAERVG
ncbi:trehalose-phosphatase [soil metagenome]